MNIETVQVEKSSYGFCSSTSKLRVHLKNIFFRFKAKTETVDDFEYLQRRFPVLLRHDYIIKPVSQTLKRHEVAESIASVSV